MVQMINTNSKRENYVFTCIRESLNQKFKDNYSKLFLDFIKDIKHNSATREQRDMLVLEYQEKMEENFTNTFIVLLNFVNKHGKYFDKRYKEEDKPTDTEMKESSDRLIKYIGTIDNEQLFRNKIKTMTPDELYKTILDLQILFNKTLKHNQTYLNLLVIKTLEKAIEDKERFKQVNLDNQDFERKSA